MDKAEIISAIDETADKAYMSLALEQAHLAAQIEEVPIGAVVVCEAIDRKTRKPTSAPYVVACACNRRESTQDPAGHAEFIALLQASRTLGSWRLCDCTVYVTLEPCIMCAGLMQQARVRRCVYGAADPKTGAFGSLYSIHDDPRLNHRIAVTAGIEKEKCERILRDFFLRKRDGK